MITYVIIYVLIYSIGNCDSVNEFAAGILFMFAAGRRFFIAVNIDLCK